jgi:hypothetical protein
MFKKKEKTVMINKNRTITKDYNQKDIISGSTVICVDDAISGDNDTEGDWDIKEGSMYQISHLYDDDNLLQPMVVIKGSKNGPFMANRFALRNGTLTNKIKTVLICEDCNTNQQSVRNAFREGKEGEAILNLDAARCHSGPDSFFLANIIPVDESEFYNEHKYLIQTAEKIDEYDSSNII